MRLSPPVPLPQLQACVQACSTGGVAWVNSLLPVITQHQQPLLPSCDGQHPSRADSITDGSAHSSSSSSSSSSCHPQQLQHPCSCPCSGCLASRQLNSSSTQPCSGRSPAGSPAISGHPLAQTGRQPDADSDATGYQHGLSQAAVGIAPRHHAYATNHAWPQHQTSRLHDQSTPSPGHSHLRRAASSLAMQSSQLRLFSSRPGFRGSPASRPDRRDGEGGRRRRGDRDERQDTKGVGGRYDADGRRREGFGASEGPHRRLRRFRDDGALDLSAMRDPYDPTNPNHNVALMNAPQQVLQLIGDPRTGVADDTTQNPFGEVTIEMLWHQISNEVYWYRYEYAGNVLKQTHRDSRLSDYSKNLIYILRAKDPQRWTIAKLADKFHIRRQRVLAILAHKEQEAHALQRGKLLAGPLSAYGCTVHLDDVKLDPETGEPLEFVPSAPGAAATASATSASEQAVPSGASLSSVAATAEDLQLALSDMLAPFGYDLQKWRQSVMDQLEAAESRLQQLLPEAAASSKESDSNTDGTAASSADPYDRLRSSFQSYKAAVGGLLEATEPLLTCEGLKEAKEAAELAAALESVVQPVLDSRPGDVAALPLVYSAAAPAASGDSSAHPELSALQQQVSAKMAGLDDAGLCAAVFQLEPHLRDAVMRLAPSVAIRLNVLGVDLLRAKSDRDYRGPRSDSSLEPHISVPGVNSDTAVSVDSAGFLAPGLPALAADLWGFRRVAPHVMLRVVDALEVLEKANAELQASILNLAEPAMDAPPAEPLAASDILRLRRMTDQYVAVDDMAAKVLGSQPGSSAWELEKRLEIIAEANPEWLADIEFREAVEQLRKQGRHAEADQMLADLSAAKQAAKGAEAGTAAGVDWRLVNRDSQPVVPELSQGAKLSWDLYAAWLDAVLARRVYPKGSGERAFYRVPSYPAFEGYTMSQFDATAEGELSALNREASKKLDEIEQPRFANNLLFNLGVRGEKLWDHSKGPLPQNFVADKIKHDMVVYDIGKDNKTIYPPLFVSIGGGSQRRPLNDQELIYQRHRKQRYRMAKLPYQVTHIPKLYEWEDGWHHFPDHLLESKGES